MIQLGLHLLGDYILQTGWMAMNKKKKGWAGHFACQVHCITYSLPFLLIGSWQATLAIYVSHFLIDRYRFVEHLISWRERTSHLQNMGFPETLPPFVAVWLYIIIDATLHLACNYTALLYL
jgi:hypothetical protein